MRQLKDRPPLALVLLTFFRDTFSSELGNIFLRLSHDNQPVILIILQCNTLFFVRL